MNRREFLDRLAELARPPRRSRSCRCCRTTMRKPRSLRRTTAGCSPSAALRSPKGRINGYLVRAKAMGKRLVIVIHENRGLNPHIGYRASIGGRLSRAGARSPVRPAARPDEDRARGRTEDRAREHDRGGARGHPFMQKHADRLARSARSASLRRRRGQPHGRRQPDLGAAVAYYGADPGRVGAGYQGAATRQYAENDENINKGIGAYETALAANNKNTPSTSIPARSTPSTTTPVPHVTTRRRPSLPGAARLFAENLGAPRRRRNNLVAALKRGGDGRASWAAPASR